jgi:chemotaxis-related protein WspB
MLFLLFQIGKDRYGLEASQIVEIVPLVTLKKIPQAPRGVAGIFNYHGVLVPVIDLSELTTGQLSAPRLSTRLILVNYPVEAEKRHVLGLMAEMATETIHLDPTAFNDVGVDTPEAPFLGPVAKDGRGLIQRIEVKKLLPDALRDRLFHQTGETICGAS